MSAEKQIEAVSKKLVELNPGFDGKLTGWDQSATPRIENGIVTELGFSTNNVSDISPVRALTGMKSLSCPGSGRGKGRLSDLLPLQGIGKGGDVVLEHDPVVKRFNRDLFTIDGFTVTSFLAFPQVVLK